MADLTLSTVEENESLPNEPVFNDELQNEYFDDMVYSPRIDSPDRITTNQQLGSIQVIIEKYDIKDFEEISSPVSESEELEEVIKEENVNVKNEIIEKEETKIIEDVPEQPAVTETIELTKPANIAPIPDKEPVRIVDYQEKKSRIHEPKIVEEMSVKKEDKSEKIKDTEEISKEVDKTSEINFTIDKEHVKDEINVVPEEEIPIPGEIEISVEDDDGNLTPISGPPTPDASKTSDDNEISSEQLKTNSLSDMSLSDPLNSEAEEAARRNAKAQELRELVASLSASANVVTLEYDYSEDSNSSRDVSRNEATVGTSLQDYEEFEPTMSETSKIETVHEEFRERSKLDSPPYDIIKQHSPEPTFQESPTSLEVPQTTSAAIIETSEDTSSASETSFKREDIKESTKPEVEEIPPTATPTMKQKKTEGDTVEEKEKDEAEVELENVESDATTHEKTIIEGELQKETELATEQSQQKEESGIIAAATAIQSGFRGYQVRKQLKESETDKEAKQAAEEEETEKSTSDEADTFLDGQIVSPTPELFDEKGQIEQQEKYTFVRSESRTSEPCETNDDSTVDTTDASMKYVPDSLIKIAQAEVDKICREAVETTEALATPPQMKDDSEIQEGDIPEEEFPAPPDDLLASDSKTEDIKDDQSSSGTQSTEPTVPLANNQTEGDSSKTEDTTAPSLAESEMPISNPQSPSQPNVSICNKYLQL